LCFYNETAAGATCHYFQKCFYVECSASRHT
jgi:hypothetical protein